MTVAGLPSLVSILASRVLNCSNKRFTDEKIVRYCRLVYAAYVLPKRMRHIKYAHCLSLSCRWLEREFGRGVFLQINQKVGWLNVFSAPQQQDYVYAIDGSLGSTRAYELTESGLGQLHSILQNAEVIEAVYSPPKMNCRAMRSRDSRDASAKERFDLPNLIEIVSPEVNLLEDSALNRQLLALNFHSYKCQNTLLIEQYYRQSPAGRWYGSGNTLGLQNCAREARSKLLRECFDYDIQCCHFALLREMTASSRVSMPIVECMLKDRSEFRGFIELSAGLSPGSAKKLLNSLAYGANLSTHPSCALSFLFSPREIDAIRALPEIQCLLKELKLGKDCLITQAIRDSANGRFTNILGKSILKRDANYEQRAAHLLQGAEAKVLSTVGSVYGPQMRLLAHDGWVLANKVPLVEIEALIESRLGWTLKVDCTEL